jgi:hypothetical protein
VRSTFSSWGNDVHVSISWKRLQTSGDTGFRKQLVRFLILDRSQVHNPDPSVSGTDKWIDLHVDQDLALPFGCHQPVGPANSLQRCNLAKSPAGNSRTSWAGHEPARIGEPSRAEEPGRIGAEGAPADAPNLSNGILRGHAALDENPGSDQATAIQS